MSNSIDYQYLLIIAVAITSNVLSFNFGKRFKKENLPLQKEPKKESLPLITFRIVPKHQTMDTTTIQACYFEVDDCNIFFFDLNGNICGCIPSSWGVI